MSELWWLVPSFFVIAVLYASVGHGGASGYLAVLSFLGARPGAMAMTALTLNLVVAGIALGSFARAGHLNGRLAWPFIAASVPAAFLGGATPVSVQMYAALLASSLFVGALRLAITVRRQEAGSITPPSWAVAVPVGAGIGWFSGVVGVGGGIFLSPLLLLLRWANAKQTAAASACFILVNSAAGLAGRFTRGATDYGMLWPLLMAACAGGLLGSRLGANHFSEMLLKRLLAVVLLTAAVKLLRMGIAS